MSSLFLIVKKELTNFTRDKNTIIYSVVFPIVLYPIVFWIMSQIMMLQKGTLEKMPSRIGCTAPVSEELVWIVLDNLQDLDFRTDYIDRESLDAKTLKVLELDAVIHPISCGDVQTFEVIYDQSSDRSKTALDRVKHVFELLQLELISGEAFRLNAELPDFNLIDVDMSSAEDRSMFLLSILLPMIIVIITVMGGMYPAIEVIVGEKERGTIETTFSSPVKASVILAGKFIAVIVMSLTAAALNIVSILLTLKQTLFQGENLDDIHFFLPAKTLPMLFIGALLVATMFSAAMILFASAARNFKEGQSFVMPIYVIGIQPAVISALPGVPFTWATALIPISNISLLLRELIRGTLTWVPTLITISTLLLWCIILLYVSVKFIRSDEIILDKPIKFLAALRRKSARRQLKG